ncbi:MAG: hypothetical protein RPU34_17075 [Candidatus Sedimenticola sp. (ex Thyasira tokunagai)]
MGNIFIRILHLVICLAPSISNASGFPKAPSTSMLHDQSGARNAVQMSCIPNYQNQSLKCQFFQMSVSYALNPEELDASIAKELRKIETNEDYLGKEPLKEIRQLCFSESKEGNKVKLHLNKMKSGPKKIYVERMLEISDEACNVTTIKKAKEIMVKLVQLNKQWQSVTCKVWPNTWEEVFRHKSTVGSQYWVSEAEPQGECGVINVSTLKKDGDYFWKYESKRVVTNREGGALLLSCKDIEERSIAYSWRSKEHNVDCKEIKFGF